MEKVLETLTFIQVRAKETEKSSKAKSPYTINYHASRNQFEEVTDPCRSRPNSQRHGITKAGQAAQFVK